MTMTNSDARKRLTSRPAHVTADELAQAIWSASRADEGTISATGARHVASMLLTTLNMTRKPVRDQMGKR